MSYDDETRGRAAEGRAARMLAGAALIVPVPVLFELRYGEERSLNPARNHERIDVFLTAITQIFDFNDADAREAGEIRAFLESRGAPIGPYDLLIAAQARQAFGFLFLGVVDDFHQLCHVGNVAVELEVAGQLAFGVQLAGLIERPHLLAVVGVQQLRGKAAKIGAHVVDVTFEHHAGIVVAGGVDGLRQVDDHRAGPAGAGEVEVIGQAIELSRTPWTVRSATPEIGEHNDEILAELAATRSAAPAQTKQEA